MQHIRTVSHIYNCGSSTGSCVFCGCTMLTVSVSLYIEVELLKEGDDYFTEIQPIHTMLVVTR